MADAPAKTIRTESSPGYTLEVPAGEYIFREGELGTEMFLIQTGTVKIFTAGAGEKEPLAVLKKGDFFGEMSLLDDLPRSATARAVTDSRLLRINGSTFTQMIQANPEIAVRMMKKLCARLRETDERLRKLTRDSSESMTAFSPDATRMARQRESLVHEPSGMEFPLAAEGETSIGRRDPVTGIHPEIDLTPVDQQRSISRRHAKIYRRGEKFFLAEETGTMNGTFKNGERLETGVPVEIQPGDEVRCGVINLRLVAR